ncbi:MAG: carbohydrate-binding protein, partial [Parafilimonas sp.]
FKPNIINAKDSVINAADYNLGRNNYAYFDKDTGNYYISTGGRNAGNKGYTYRNDGVDIYKDSSHYESYYVGSIEDSEWMQYTINVTKTGTYKLKLNVAAESAGSVSIQKDDKDLFTKTGILPTGSLKNWQTQTIGDIQLNAGKHVIKVYFNTGGFNLKQLIFSVEK